MPIDRSKLSKDELVLLDSISRYLLSHVTSRLSDFYSDDDFYYAPEDLIFCFDYNEMELLRKVVYEL